MVQIEIDETLQRLHDTGPEFQGWLSNHGPMAADALMRLGHSDDVEAWVDGYVNRLETLPTPRWGIAVDGWRDPLGDASRLGDWLVFFEQRLAEASWRDVLVEWWPRLLPGGIASATHALIRTGHAVRLLTDGVTPARTSELAQALGYWAARWAPLPDVRPSGVLGFGSAFGGLPTVPDDGGARTRVAALPSAGWPAAAERVEDVDGAVEVGRALDALVDAAVSRYGQWASAEPTMLVHMATAPRAARLVLPALPEVLWAATYRYSWSISAAIASMYRPAGEPAGLEVSAALGVSAADAADVVAAATATGDEHAIKFAEVALESHARGNPDALPAIGAAARLLAG